MYTIFKYAQLYLHTIQYAFYCYINFINNSAITKHKLKLNTSCILIITDTHYINILYNIMYTCYLHTFNVYVMYI